MDPNNTNNNPVPTPANGQVAPQQPIQQPVQSQPVPQPVQPQPAPQPAPAPVPPQPVPQPVQPQPAPTGGPVPPVPAPAVPPKKNKKITVIIIIIAVLLVLGVGGYFVITGIVNKDNSSNKESNNTTENNSNNNEEEKKKETTTCIELEKKNELESYSSGLLVTNKEVKYYFNTKFDQKMIKFALNNEDTLIEICYREAKESDFAEGEVVDIKNIKTVERLKFYDKVNKKDVDATTYDELINQLGYHPVGKNIVAAKIIEKSNVISHGTEEGREYDLYNITIELFSGHHVIAKLYVYDGDTSVLNKIEVNRQYLMEFEVKEQDVDLVYIITDIKV